MTNPIILRILRAETMLWSKLCTTQNSPKAFTLRVSGDM